MRICDLKLSGIVENDEIWYNTEGDNRSYDFFSVTTCLDVVKYYPGFSVAK